MPLVRFSFSDGGTRAASKQLRADINREARRIAKDIAQSRCVPAARRYAPSLYRNRIRAGATNRGGKVYIGGSVTQKRTAGWLEFGGSIRPLAGPYLVFQIDGRWVRVPVVRRTRVPTGRYVGRAMRSRTLMVAATRETRERVGEMLRRRLAASGGRVTG